MNPVEIYTDGSCSPNPGNGGWGAIICQEKDTPVEISGAERDTTNNRMEMTAVIRALEAVSSQAPVKITTDSQYLSKAFTENWLGKWVRNGWKTSTRKPVKNADLWKRLLELVDGRDCEWAWIEGHNNHPENERCDTLANQARESLQ